jgi:hypothetical protein
MNPFEYFQQLKPLILENQTFMDSLQTYAFTDRLRLIGNAKVTPLGAGRNNIHFRIGKINDLWIASREHIENIFEVEDKMQHCENYIAKAVSYHEEGKRVPLVCGCVKAIEGNHEKYFLLVEDLTDGGIAHFIPAGKSGKMSGRLKGIEVFHDFDTEDPFHPPRHYLAEDKLLR